MKNLGISKRIASAIGERLERDNLDRAGEGLIKAAIKEVVTEATATVPMGSWLPTSIAVDIIWEIISPISEQVTDRLVDGLEVGVEMVVGDGRG